MLSINKALIIATERVPSSLRRILGPQIQANPTPDRVEGIDKFVPEHKARKRSLLVLSPSAWMTAVRQYPSIKKFNFDGLTFEMVRVLNLRGYVVDIVDYLNPITPTSVKYDIVIAHGPNCRSIIDAAKPEAVIIQYASGAYWKAFNEMSRERYERFWESRNLEPRDRFFRSLEGLEGGEEYLARHADATFIPGYRTLKTWEGVSKAPQMVYLGAYQEDDFVVPHDFEAGRRNFIYLAGTGGNIQKGLDLLLEAFARTPQLHLYIYCKVENEVLQAYDDILKSPNIHYVYHLRFGPLRRRMAGLLKRINFTISAPINTGTGTAFVGSLGLGLIPVGYVDIDAGREEGCLTNSWELDSLSSAILDASQKPVEWYHRASHLAIERYQRYHEPASFSRNFDSFLNDVLGA